MTEATGRNPVGARVRPHGEAALPGVLYAVLALGLVLPSVGLLAMSGGLTAIGSGPLRAELRVSDFALPDAAQIQPKAITSFLASELQDRARNDPALRVMLGSNVPEKVADTVIPRLVNDDVITRMIRQSAGLTALLDSARYRHLVEGRISNRGDRPLTELALTLPGTLLVEREDGSPVEIRRREDRVDALLLGELDPGESVRVRAWLGETDAALPAAIRLTSAEGAGRVVLDAAREGIGARLDRQPWSAVVVAGTLGALALVSALGLLAALGTALRARLRRQARG